MPVDCTAAAEYLSLSWQVQLKLDAMQLKY